MPATKKGRPPSVNSRTVMVNFRLSLPKRRGSARWLKREACPWLNSSGLCRVGVNVVSPRRSLNGSTSWLRSGASLWLSLYVHSLTTGSRSYGVRWTDVRTPQSALYGQLWEDPPSGDRVSTQELGNVAAQLRLWAFSV